jgi:nucleotide-binding universal stress UspA family protein
MGMKDLLVHVNVSRHCRKRLEIAAHLAKSFDARLTGLYTSAAGDVPFFMMEEIVSTIEPTMRGWWLQTRDRVKSDFDAFLRETGIAADWVEVENEMATTVPYHARYADLTIVGQTDPADLLPRAEHDIAEAVALDSGRPVLVVPYAGSFPTLGQRVLVAWNGSAQSARAVNDALPFLRRAEKVTILTINPQGRRNRGSDRPGARIAAHLAHYGVEAEPQELPAPEVEIDQLILSRASDLGADLIVMGAYGHPRAREMVLGGATRAVFEYMTVPILMSH